VIKTPAPSARPLPYAPSHNRAKPTPTASTARTDSAVSSTNMSRSHDLSSGFGHPQVQTIQRAAAPDRWSVTTDRGTTSVDNTGIGSAVVPLDPDIQADLYLHGDGYLVTSTSIGVESSTEQDSSFERGDDLGLG
jgi:hypothetical protein